MPRKFVLLFGLILLTSNPSFAATSTTVTQQANNGDIKSQTKNKNTDDNAQGYTNEHANQLQTQTTSTDSGQVQVQFGPQQFRITHRDGYNYISTTDSKGDTAERELKGDEGLTINIGDTTIRVTAGSDGQFHLTQNNTKVTTYLPVSFDQNSNQVSLTSGDQVLPLSLTPEQARNQIQERYQPEEVSSSEIIPLQNQLAYRYTATIQKRLFRLFPIMLEYQLTLSGGDTTSTPTSTLHQLLNLLSV